MLYITYIIYKIMYDICRESIDIYIGVYRLYIYIYIQLVSITSKVQIVTMT